MAYTTDKNWNAGEVVTASDMNVWVRDNLKWLSTDKPMARCYQNVKNTVNAGVTALLTYDTKRFDNATLNNTTSRMTIPTSSQGRYLFGTYSLMPGQATPGNYHGAAIRLTGATTISAQQVQVVNSAAFGPGISNVTFWSTSVADWFDSSYAQDGGGPLTFLTAEFWAVWIGFA